MVASWRTRLIICVSFALTLPVPMRAQQGQAALEVRGRFLADPGGAPLAGAYVTLVDGGGSVKAATLTNLSGWFSLTASTAGRYTVRAELIGYATAHSVIDLPTARPRLLELRAAFQAIALEGITAEVDKECRVPAPTAERVATLWDEVRKAFRVTAFVEDRSVVLFDVDRWTRTLDPERLSVQEEERRPRTGLHPGSPFVSLDPQRLADDGYVQGERGDEEIRYYGPDAHVLLDPSFQSTHCFGFRDKGPEKGWVGLQFRPRDARARDIEGTLWIDRETYAPRRLEYHYPQLPWRLDTDKVGGEVDFTRIPEGPWIVSRWWIRMPVVRERSFRVTSSASPEVRYGLAALIEQGGEVRSARTDDRHLTTFAMGGIDGVVTDSLGGGPVSGARVGVVGTFFQDTTDSHGRFRFTDVPQGRYQVSASTAELSQVSPGLRSAVADVMAGADVPVEIRLPSAAAVARASCGPPITDDGKGVLWGAVHTLDGQVPEGSVVEVSWDRVRGRLNAGAGLGQTTRRTTVAVRPNGGFTVCGIPEDQTLSVKGTAPTHASPETEVRFEDDDFRAVDLVLAPLDRVDALEVQVREHGGRKPVEAATVSLVELGRSLATDARGNAVFSQVPVGKVTLKIEHPGYPPRTDSLDVSAEGRTTVTVELPEKAYELEPITVTVLTPEIIAQRSNGSSANIKIGQPTIQRMMKERGANDVAEVIRRALPSGVKISPLIHGMNKLGTCIESTRGALNLRKGFTNSCAMVMVVVDGGVLTTEEAARLVEDFPLSEIVSMEFLSPMEQSFRYGPRQDGQAWGMLIIETARR